MQDSAENTPVRLSRDAVRALHQNFQTRVHTEAATAAARAGDTRDHIIEAAKNYLLAATRRRVDVTTTDLETLIAAGTGALSDATVELKTRRLFTAEQEEALLAGATARQDPANVRAVFGDEMRLYLRCLDAGDRRTEHKVGAYLETLVYRITDYNKGRCTDATGKQDRRIGRLLKTEPDLLAEFEDDQRRSLGHLLVVISRHPDDIARMSAGRGWETCMSPHKKEFKFVPEEIRAGTLVAYLISEKDPEVNDPLARLLIRPYAKMDPEIEEYKKHAGTETNYYRLKNPLKSAFEKMKIEAKWLLRGRPAGADDIIYMTEDKSYGFTSPSLRHTVAAFVQQYLSHGSDGDYYLSPQLYTDSLARHALVEGGTPKIKPLPFDGALP